VNQGTVMGIKLLSSSWRCGGVTATPEISASRKIFFQKY